MNLWQLNLNCDTQKKTCIFGTGKKAATTLSELNAIGVKVDCLVDRIVPSDPIYGMKCISEDELASDPKGYVVIISSAWHEDIYKRLVKYGIKDIYIDLNKDDGLRISDGYLRSCRGAFFKEDTTYICCNRGIGDTVIVCSYVNCLKKDRGIEKVCVIVKSSQREVPMMFEAIDEVISSDSLAQELDNLSIYNSMFELKNYLYGFFKMDVACNFMGDYLKHGLLEAYKKNVMCLPDVSFCEKVNFTKIGLTEIDPQKMSNSVILMPDANSVDLLEEVFWCVLAEELRKNDVDVYVNGNMSIPGTKAIFESIAKTAYLCRNCLAVISLRSGMCDLLAMLPETKLLVIHSQKYSYNLFNLSVMFKRNDIFDYYYGDYSKDELIDRIINNVLYK